MKIVRHHSFLDSLCELSPNISWLSAFVPKLLRELDSNQASVVDVACKDLALKVNQLVGEVIDLDTLAIEVGPGTVLIVNNNDKLETIEAPAVLVILKDDSLKSLQDIEERLRAALAEIVAQTIVARAEAQGILPEEDSTHEPTIEEFVLGTLATKKPVRKPLWPSTR